jgi:hypothetical protein
MRVALESHPALGAWIERVQAHALGLLSPRRCA